MQIKQVVILSDGSQALSDILPGFEQLGLQISDSFSPNSTGSLIICNHGFESTLKSTEIIRHALNNGCCVLMDLTKAQAVFNEIRQTGEVSEETRRSLASYALFKCIESDARQLAALQSKDGLPLYAVSAYEKIQDTRYGENWHQRAAVYKREKSLGLYAAEKLNGKEMSYNNFVDAEAVLEMLIDLSEYDGNKVNKPLSVIVKHANPCGVAYGKSLGEAYKKSLATDPKSAFGGVIGFSEPVDIDTANAIGESFVEVLLAPGYDPIALKRLTDKKPNRRILDIGDLLSRKNEIYSGFYQRNIFGGMMLQDYDTGDIKEWKVVTKRAPTDSEAKALRFAWKIAKYVKSNALVYTTEDQTIGIGSGQVSRVDSARFGREKAEEHHLSTVGTVAATDSFFPFRDGLDEVHKAGATAAVHPGGSIRDAEVIDAANEHGMSMVFTGMRHFRH